MVTSRHSYPIQLDGMVIKINNLKIRDELGYATKYPKWATAFKFPALEKETKILDIVEQVGRTGIVTPVAIIEPIDIDGVLVTRVTLNNYTDIIRKDIRINDTVTVIRSGDVIPKIIRVITDNRENNSLPITIPSTCKYCNSSLIKNNAYIKCTNVNCSERLVNNIIYFTSRECMYIDGVGEELIRKLVSTSKIRNLIDIFKLNMNDLIAIDKVKTKLASKILYNINNVIDNRPLHIVIKSLGIDHVGSIVSKKIADAFGLDFINPNNDFSKINGIGVVIIESINQYIKANRDAIIELLNIVNPVIHNRKEGKLNNTNIVITGILSIPRNEMIKLIEEHGGVVQNSVTSNTDYVVSNIQSSAKLDRAIKLGIKIINEKQLLDMIN